MHIEPIQLSHKRKMNSITIYHNPKCSTSRNTLGLIRESGEEPNVVLYLETPLTREQLLAIIQATGGSVRNLMRSKEAVYNELDLSNEKHSDEGLIAAILAHPILMNRPIVVTPKGTRLCRPAELVLDLLK